MVQLVNILKREKALDYTIIIGATASEAAAITIFSSIFRLYYR